MRNKKNIKKENLVQWKNLGSAALIVALFFIFIYGISWILSCGIIKLICLCFGLKFKWSVATGIWLIMCLLQSVFVSRNKNE